MDVYLYQADLYCCDCGESIRTRLDADGERPEEAERDGGLDEEMYDSDDYPKGPHPDGGGEADGPQSCGACGRFLENPLTRSGHDNLMAMIEEHIDRPERGDHTRLDEWIEFYGVTLADVLGHVRPRWMWWFDSAGNFLRAIPPQAVADCAAGGRDATPFVSDWVNRLDFAVQREGAIGYLVKFGAWTREELVEMTNRELARKVFWIACGDIKDQGEWLGLIH